MDETFDFVVVGSGGGSMCAALVMRKAGRSVLILEKTDLIGGSTAKSGGVMWIPGNRFLRQAGIDDSIEKGEEYLNSIVEEYEGPAPGTSRELRRTYVVEANAMLEFLIDQGIPFERAPSWPDYYDDRPGGNARGRTVHAKLFNVNELGDWKTKLRPNYFPLPLPVYDAMALPLINRSWKAKLTAARMVLRGSLAKLTGKYWVTAGAALQGRMLKAALKAGVEFRTNSPVKELIIEDGECVGVFVESEGKPLRIGAKLGVLVNAGGFAHNQKMRDQYMPHTRSEWSIAAEGDTGDMHQEMMRIGAQMGQMEEMVGSQNMIPPSGTSSGAQLQLAKPHAFLVDQLGERYMNEGGSYMLFCQSMLDRHKTVPAVPSWMILDSQYTKKYMLADTLPGSKKPDHWFSSGFLRTGNTIEELAMACGMEGARLRATTERFNQFARAGKDEDFGRGDREYDRWLGDFTHKPNATLGTVEVGPFYAVAINPGDVGTFGGVVTDEKARVLREDGSLVNGLYAAGTTTASVMGRTYPGAGCSIGPSFTWGFIAAKHAAGLDNSGA